MKNTQYIDDWNNRNEEFGSRRKAFEDKHESVEDTLIPEKIKLVKWLAYTLLVVGLALSTYWYATEAAHKILGLIPIGLGAATYVPFLIMNWEILPANRKTKKQMRGITAKIDKLNTEEHKSKRDLSIEFAAANLATVSHGENLTSKHSKKIIKYADVYRRTTRKDSKGRTYTTRTYVRNIMYSVGGVKLPIFLMPGEYLTNYTSIDVFFLDSIADENDYQIIKADPSIRSKAFNITIEAKKIENGTLKVIKPYKSSKRKWNEEYPELIGEYYPKVEAGSQQDLFGYFTPRRIDFFLNNENAKLIHEIEGSIFTMKQQELSVDFLHIKDDWGDVSPDEIIKRVEEYSGAYCLAKYNMDNHKAFTNNMLDIFK